MVSTESHQKLQWLLLELLNVGGKKRELRCIQVTQTIFTVWNM